MKQTLCLFMLSVWIITIGKAENIDKSTSYSEFISLTETPAGKDTFFVSVTINSATIFCADTSEVQPIGAINVFDCTTQVNNGFATVEADSSCFSYEVANFIGTDTICVEVCNLFIPTSCDTSIFIIKISPLDPPMPMDDNIIMMEGETVTIDILANDVVTGDPSIAIIDSTDNGQLIIESNNNVTYIPDSSYCGIDQFIYWVCNGTCEAATVTINIVCSDEKELEIYNSFSPNGDGFNDLFVIDGLETVPDNKIFIYNRWGILVYTSAPYKNGWDGKWNDEDLPDGTYFYVFDDGIGNIKKGYIQLHR